MTSDPDHVRDEEIVTVDAEGQAGTAPPRDSDSTDTGDRVDTGDATDQAEAEAALSGAGDTGVMMDSRDTGTVDRTDVGEREDADADESDR